MASSKETYCLCGQPYNVGQFMIECDCCREWFHGSCVNVKIYHSDDIDKYHCPKCAQTYGQSVFKTPTNNHRADRYEVGAAARPSQAGSPAWVRALAARPPRPSHASLQRMRAQQFTEDFVKDNGFTRPVFFQTPDGLDMKTPNPATFTVRSVLRYCGAQFEVEVIDVRRQSTLRMPLSDFVEYFETAPEGRDEKVLNVISLEFSDTNMSPLVEPPAVLRRLDWAQCVWAGGNGRGPRPAVQKYCLMSAGGSYTDFHVDFGGTTVWYHVMHGRKIFYLVPPTSTNLALYQQWSASNNQSERFFGDMVEWYGTAEVNAGETLLIPSGWIHAVLTPQDTLVFGGNLLHSYAIETQLQIYEIERRVETPTMFRYPLFEPMHWYAGAHLLSLLRRHNEEIQDEEFTLSEHGARNPPPDIPPLLLRGIKILATALKEWHALKSTDSSKRDNVPKCLNSGQLVRELCKELRTLEKRVTSAIKDKDFKPRNSTPKKSSRSQQKKSLKLTLPKPIMHNISQNGEYQDDKIYADKFYIDNKEVVFHDNRYITQDMKYVNGLPEQKYIVDGTGKDVMLPEKYAYPNYEEIHYGDGNICLDRHDKKGNVLRIKMNSPPSSSRSVPAAAPPPYPLPPAVGGPDEEHSILKQQLVRSSEHSRPALKPIHQWTISKKDIGDYQEEVLFTNDNLQGNIATQQITYGPGMYSAEDIQQEYEYVGAKPAPYEPEYGYGSSTTDTYPYQRYELHPPPPQPHPQPAHIQSTPYVCESGESTYTTLPPYEAPHQFAAAPPAAPPPPATTEYQVVEETKPPEASPPTGLRRSVRPVRRRVSTTYDYSDAELYVDDPPPPRRARHRDSAHHLPYKHAMPGSNARYSGGGGAARPANGIESLIQASVLAEEKPVNATEDVAVEGMLSISERYTHSAPAPDSNARQPDSNARQPDSNARTHSATFGLAHTTPEPSKSTASGSKRARRGAAGSADEGLSDEEDVIREVHRDDEYVYPSLEMSSDDDEEWTASRRRRNSRNRHDTRSKSDKDESWSPRARLGRLVPRVRAPHRAAVRRECVRAALHHAATSAHHAHHTHHAQPKHKAPSQPPQVDVTMNAKRAVLATKSRRPPPPVQPAPSNKNIRLKKGMKTAKQRLGKILKIHKMIY